MAKVIDFRRASRENRGRSKGKRQVGGVDSIDPDVLKHAAPEKPQQRRISPLLPFAEQISIGKSFKIIVGNIDFDKRPETPEGPRVMGPAFNVTKRLIGNLRSNSPRAKQGDVLLTIERAREERARDPEPGSLAAVLGLRSEAGEETEKRPSKYHVGRSYREVGPELDGCLLARGVIALRPKDRSVSAQELTRFLRLYGFGVYADEVVDWPILGEGGDAVRDVVQRLRAASIPVIPADLIEALDEFFMAGEEESHNPPNLTELLRSRSQIEMHRSVARLRARTYALRQSIDECDSLPYLIRNFYPFPLAFRYRATQMFPQPAERYHEQLAFVEGILAFLASVALSLIEPAPGVLVTEDRKPVRFSCGHWLNAFEGARKRLAPCSHPDLPGALGLLSLRKFVELVNRRNDLAHTRVPTTRLGEEERKLKKLIEECLEELAFFVRFRLIRILPNFTTDRRTNRVIH